MYHLTTPSMTGPGPAAPRADRRNKSGLPLAPGDIHVWQVALDRAGLLEPPFGESWLSSDERSRAARLRHEDHRRRYVAARGLLRLVLAQYLAVAPEEVRFGYGPQGKPFLAGPPTEPGLQFNATHSAELTLVAVTRVGEIGVDVERRRAVPEWPGIAGACFAAADWSRLQTLPPGRGREEFFRLWTAYEARLKALGLGLGAGAGMAEESRFGTLHQWEPAPGYVAALAVAGADARARRLVLVPWFRIAGRGLDGPRAGRGRAAGGSALEFEPGRS